MCQTLLVTDRVKQKQSQATGKIFNNDASDDKYYSVPARCYPGHFMILSHLIIITIKEFHSFIAEVHKAPKC